MKKGKKRNIFKKIGNGIKNFFVNIYNNFMKIKPIWRKIIILWICILLFIIILILLCSGNNKVNYNHKKMEDAMSAAALDYTETNELYGTVDKKVKVSLEEMIDQEYLYDEDITDKSCTGYSLVYTENDETFVDSYLLCKGYTTSGFKVK